MNFPAVYSILRDGFECEPDYGLLYDRAEDGTPRTRSLYGNDWYNIRFRIGLLTGQQVIAVESFVGSYRNEFIGWTDPLTERKFQIKITEPPRVVRIHHRNAVVMQITAVGYVDATT